jgi:hypothetical protein
MSIKADALSLQLSPTGLAPLSVLLLCAHSLCGESFDLSASCRASSRTASTPWRSTRVLITQRSHRLSSSSLVSTFLRSIKWMARWARLIDAVWLLRSLASQILPGRFRILDSWNPKYDFEAILQSLRQYASCLCAELDSRSRRTMMDANNRRLVQPPENQNFS